MFLKKRSEIITTLTLLSLLAPLSWVTADVIVLKNGERLEGIVTKAPGDDQAVMFENSRASTKIALSRIKTLTEESADVDLEKIADQYYRSKKYQKALVFYQKSLDTNAQNQNVKDKIETTQAAVARVASNERRNELSEIDRMLLQVDQLIEDEKFDDARSILEDKAAAQNPTAEQQAQIVEGQKALYRAWCFDRVDKMYL